MRLPIPNDWDGQSYCAYHICWPDSTKWKALLMGWLTRPKRGWTWDEKTGDLMAVIEIGQQIYDLNIPLEESIMSCSDLSTLSLSLAQIADAIKYSADQKCSCGGTGSTGSSGAGSTDQPASPTNTIDPSQPVPEGFNDWAEYLEFKCGEATRIIDEIIEDVANMSTLNLIGAALTELIPVLLVLLATPVPFDEIAALAALIIAAFAASGSILGNTLATIQDLREELICDLYASSNATNARDRFVNTVNEYVDVNYPGQPDNIFIKAILAAFAGFTSFNRLSTPDPINPPPTGDCSECGVPCIVYWTFATAIDPFVYEDVSDVGSTSIYEIAEPNGLQWTNTVASLPNTTAQADYETDGDGMTIAPGDQIQIDHEPITGRNVGYSVTITLLDESTQTVSITVNDAGTYNLTFTTLTGTIDTIKLSISNSTSFSALGYTNTGIVREMRLYLANSLVCLTGN